MEVVSRRAFLASASAAVALSSCTDTRNLKVLLFNIRDEVNLVANQLWEFASKKKIYVDLSPTEYKLIRETANKELFDVMYVDDVWMAEFAHDKKIVPLNNYIDYHIPEFNYDFSEKIRTDMASISDELGGGNDVTHWMIPQRADVQVLFYNKEIFEDSGVRADYLALSGGHTLEVPNTWHDYNLAAKILGKIKFRNTEIIPVVETLAAPHYAFEFFASRYWASSGADLFDSDIDPKKAVFAESGAVEALALLRDVLPYAAPGSISAVHEDSVARFKRGNCALMPQWYTFYAELSNPLDALGSRLGVARLPGIQRGDSVKRKPCLGGGSLAITNTSDRKALAWEFVRYFTGMEIAAKAGSMGLVTPRFSGYQSFRNEELASPTAVYRKSLEDACPRPRHRHYAYLEDIIGNAINQALRSKGKEEEILLGAQASCNQHFLVDGAGARPSS